MNQIEKTTDAVNTAVVLNDNALTTVGTFANAVNLLAGMEAKRITWEQGAYRTSNSELYAVLAECLSYCGELVLEQAKQRSAALERFYKERNYSYKSEVPLATRVVRAVFGNIDRRRISTYSLVLRQAQKAKVQTADLAQWIEDNGGIQEIRLGKSATYISPKAKAEIAKAAIAGRKSFLGIAKSELLSHVADADFMGEACVLLAEQQADGSFGIRAVLRNEAVVNAAYAALYGKQQVALAEAKAAIEAANDADGAVDTQTQAA
ncbi:hypothetical protein [Polynucleobacter sp. P1-05-14]|uniref:hypothetical protein n=1 Tax=Polynucleobacter sp. P1-05-14 TaxID=1819732 RepID=UPI001C0BEA90|nr:hypothetical protein [Polynucleobacter sp. P1-05-14]MBU3548644.1 hypothetical protein [Polynucleobacter sp. P1-05-14]